MKDLFVNLGATETQMQTYLKLLELGAQPASVIARHVGVPRTTMYLILEDLKKLGLVEEFERARIKFFKSISANKIKDLIEAKESKLQYTKKLLENNLSGLINLENKLSITPKVKFYEGRDAVMKLYEDVLKESNYYAFFNPEVKNPIMEIYFDKIGKAICKNKLKVKDFVVDCKKGREYARKFNTAYHQIKVLPGEASFDADNIICRDKIYMISYGEKEVSGVEVFSESLAKSYMVMFEELWKRF